MTMRKKKVVLLFVMALLIWCSPVLAAVIPGLTGVVDGGAYNDDSQTIGATAEGKYTVTLADKSGNIQTTTFWIDRTAPVVDGVENGGVYNSARNITLSDGTNGSGVDSATLNGESKPATTFPVPNEGTYTLVVTDKAGNTATVHFTIDTKPVITSFTSYYTTGDDGYFVWKDYTLVAIGTDNGIPFTAGEGDTVVKKLDGTVIDNCFGLSEDNYGGKFYTPDFGVYRVYLKDNEGNISDNYVSVNWTGSSASLVPYTE